MKDKIFEIVPEPKPLGYFLLVDRVHWAVHTKKPIWLHRKMIELCFGIKWLDQPLLESYKPKADVINIQEFKGK